MHALRPITLHHPARITFGAHCAAATLGEFVRGGAYRRVLVVTSPSVLSLAGSSLGPTKAQGVLLRIASNVPPEPTVRACAALREEANAFKPDVVVAIGGGSVLDAAKIVAALHDQTGSLESYFGVGAVPARRTALVCIATTAGTGSEVSPNALLYDESVRAKKAIISPALVPDLAIVDPALTLSVPAALTATTGIDALTHCIETYANLAAHPIVDLSALEGVRLIGRHLAAAVANGTDLETRSAVALGSLYGGLGLGPVNTAGVHALAYPLGGEFHLAHGLSIALLLPHVVRFNSPAMPERYADLARALGASDSLSAPDAAAECAPRLEALISACRIPRGLSAHGIPRDAVPRLVEGGLAVTRLLKNNPRPISGADARQIYEAAF